MRKPELFLKMNRLTHSGEIVREEVRLMKSGLSPDSGKPLVVEGAVSPSTVSGLSGLKASYISPESDATDIRNQKELNFNLEEARVVAEMNPQMLSLRELYMVALSYKNEPEQFISIIETSSQDLSGSSGSQPECGSGSHRTGKLAGCRTVSANGAP